ncbi:MAG: site-2 protease family protein [Armatimonadetes bacterium]|nr:site-2 protease family protein [Armatimonadota bacterium]
MGGVKLGKILGFEISMDWSWLLIFFLVVYTLANGYFPTFYPSFTMATNWLMGVLAAVLLFVSVLIHELSHSVIARSYGTEIRGITLFLFGGMSQAADEPKSAREEFWMALAGPLTSFLLAVIFYLIGGLGVDMGWPGPLVAVLGYLAMINVLLGAFNLLPGFPLDGGRVLRSAIWGWTDDLEKATRYASYSGQGFGYLLMTLGFLDILGRSLVGGLWLIFIGWFLAGAARQSYQQLIVRQALSGVRVEQVMTCDVPAVPSDLSIRQFVDDQLLRHEYSCYPVTQGDEVVGVVGAEEVRTVPSDRWDFVRVGDIKHQIDNAYKIGAEDDAWDALTKLADQSVCRLMVVEDDHLRGTVGRESVFRLVQTKVQMKP